MIKNTPKRKHLVVGLTGGIGSGKTAVSNQLKNLGAFVIDTDEIAHQMTQSNGLAIPSIREAFGQAALLANGAMNRDWMRSLIFKDATKREMLENILHPAIREIVGQQLQQDTPLYFVVVVPLLFEKKGWEELVDEIVVVDCPVDQQVQRVVQRNGWSTTQVLAIINNQASRETRLAAAHHVIENKGTTHELIEKINFLHQELIKKRQK